MTTTLARCLGPEGQVELEIMVPGEPPTISAAVSRPVSWDSIGEEEMMAAVSYDKVVYVKEFSVSGDPIMATYRRRVIWRQCR